MDVAPQLDPSATPVGHRGEFWQMVVHGLRMYTFAPQWLPARLRRPPAGYAGALLMTLAAVALEYFLKRVFPGFGFPAALSFVAIVTVALTWGLAPALFASLVSVISINFFVLSPQLAWSLGDASDAAGVVFFLGTAITVSIVASQAEGRRQQLAEERARLAIILDLVPDPLTVWEPGGTVAQVNRALQQPGRLPPGMSLMQLGQQVELRTLDGAPLPLDESPVARALRGEEVPPLEVRLVRGSDAERFVQIQATALRDADGRVTGAITLSHDITAFKQAEAERARLLEAEQRARMEAESAVRQLEAIQAVTDTALAHLSVQDLPRELVVRLTEVLAVDNAAILLTAEDGQHVVLHMARGPEEEVAGQVRIPIGRGIAGTIAATRQPLVVDDLSAVEVANPFLKQTIRSLMGVPLVVEDRLVGILHVGTVHLRHFSEGDLRLLQLVGERIAWSLDHARLYEEERRLRAEAADRAGELEAVFEAIADSVFVFGPAGEARHWNSAARAQFGMDAAPAFSAQPLQELSRIGVLRGADSQLVPQDQWPIYRVLRGEVLTGEHPADHMVYRRNGAEREYSVSGAPIRDGRGTISGAVCVLRDVTERRRLEAQVAAERDRLQQVLDVLPEGIVIADARPQTVVAMNRAAEEILGVKLVGQVVPIEVPGTNGEFGARHLDGTFYPPAELPLERALLRGEVVRGDQFLVRNAVSKRETAILASSAPLRDAHGVVDGAVAVFQDITAIKDLERQREEFLATVSHDLKNPLTGILGMSQILQRRLGHIEEPERTRFGEGLEAIARTVQQMASQINELLDITRVQMGRPLQLERAQADVVALLAHVVEEYQRTTDHHTLHLQSAVDSLISMVDAARLHRALANLLANAIKYSPGGGDILVTLRRTEDQDGAWLTISVADKGIGIPSAEVDRIFEGFYRASNVVDWIAGSGLGLTGVRQIVEQHGGTIALESTQGVGTTVTIRLPLADPSLEEVQ